MIKTKKKIFVLRRGGFVSIINKKYEPLWVAVPWSVPVCVYKADSKQVSGVNECGWVFGFGVFKCKNNNINDLFFSFHMKTPNVYIIYVRTNVIIIIRKMKI